jgi:hypothetical protein
MAATSALMSIGFTRISSVWSRVAWTVASIFGNELNNIVMAFGLAWRIALTTVRPSPVPDMCITKKHVISF